ncbi:MAG: acyl-CoA thioesterase [Muribaculaceae bacterium]|nr:acyl-CoA thioesterase [Muribaculaceae bacterium]
MNPERLPDVNEFRHHCDLQIRFSDVDVLGHVNNTVYMTFYDTGKAHYFSDILGKRIDWKHVECVIANVDCAFLASIFFGEDIEVLTRCEYIGEKSFRLLQVIREKGSGILKSACETVMVSFDAESGKAMELPSEWRKALERDGFPEAGLRN